MQRCSTTASCAGTVRPRQVQCLMENPAIAQVSASQHQLLSLLVLCCFKAPPQALSTEVCDSSRCSQFCMGLHSGDWWRLNADPAKLTSATTTGAWRRHLREHSWLPLLVKSACCNSLVTLNNQAHIIVLTSVLCSRVCEVLALQ